MGVINRNQLAELLFEEIHGREYKSWTSDHNDRLRYELIQDATRIVADWIEDTYEIEEKPEPRDWACSW